MTDVGARPVNAALLLEELNHLVGSSSSTMEGLMSSSCPTDTRLRSPPEMPRRKYDPAHKAVREHKHDRFTHHI